MSKFLSLHKEDDEDLLKDEELTFEEQIAFEAKRRKILAIVFTSILLVFAIGLRWFVGGHYAQMLDTSNANVNVVKNQIESLKVKNDSKSNRAVRDALGMDKKRKAEDDAIFVEFAKRVTTWSSSRDYSNMRVSVMKDYNLGEKDNLMTGFLHPDVPIDLDGDGTKESEIDVDGLNMSYVSSVTTVTNVDHGKYSYFTVVTVQSSDKAGNSAQRDIVATYTIDDQGKIANNIEMVGV